MPRPPRRLPPPPAPGLAIAKVTDTADPQQLGRVRLSLARGESWAPVVGAPWQAAVGDAVVVGFADGDQARPLVLGTLAPAHPPVLRTADGLTIALDDPAGGVTITTVTGAAIRLGGDGDAVRLDDDFGNRLTLGNDGVRIEAATMVRISAALVTVETGMCTVAGTLKCSTLIADSVVAASYTPGAGNLV